MPCFQNRHISVNKTNEIMKAQKISLLVTLMFLALAPQGFSYVPESNEKPVNVVVDFYPNYAGHLLGVSEIGYQSNYADIYQNSIKPKDLEYLRENPELLQWEPGDEGPLTSVFISFPGYINPDTKEALAEYLHDLNSAIAQKSFDLFYKKYNQAIVNLDSWCGFSLNSYIYEYEEEIQKISQILMNNFDNFKYWVWPKESRHMKILANSMNYQLKKLDLIKKWEEKTGIDFKAPSYQIILSAGMANGPTGKALGYEKGWCYYGENPDKLIQRICQDAGRRLLVNVCCNKYNEYDPLLCYQVYEALNKYMTEMILAEVGRKTQAGDALDRQDDLYRIFDSIMIMNPEIKANDLYAIALQNFSKADAFAGQ